MKNGNSSAAVADPATKLVGSDDEGDLIRAVGSELGVFAPENEDPDPNIRPSGKGGAPADAGKRAVKPKGGNGNTEDEPELDEDGKPKARAEDEPELDEDGNPKPKEEEPELDEDGKPKARAEDEPELDEDGNPKPKVEDDDEVPEAERKGWPASAQKRVAKLTKKRREAEETAATAKAESERLKAELEGAKAGRPIVSLATPEDPLADIVDAEALQARVDQARKVKRWALQNMDGGTVKDAKGEERQIEAQGVREMLANADELLTEHAPRRMQYLQATEQILPQVKAVYPELLNPGSKAYQAAQAALRQFPELKRHPNHLLILGDALAGQALRLKPKAKVADPKLATPAKAPPRAPAAAPAPRKPQGDSTDKRARAMADGNEEAVADYVGTFLK